MADFLFHQDDIEGITQKSAMVFFKELKAVKEMVLIM